MADNGNENGNGNETLTFAGAKGQTADMIHVDCSSAATDRRQRVMNLVGQILVAFGEDISSEDLQETPRRFYEVLAEFHQHTDADLVRVLKSGFQSPSEDTGLVVQQNIPFRALCPHHLLPVLGNAAIGYIPNKRIVGLSKLSRIVQVAGTIRPDTQESITGKIAGAISSTLEPRGVIVYIKALHTCMCARGVKSPINTWTTTSVVRGVFRDVPSARQEFFDILKVGGGL